MAGTTLNTRLTLLHAFGTTTGTTIPVVAATVVPTGQRVGIYRMLVTLSAAATLTVQDTSGTTLSQAFQLPANGSIALDVSANGDAWWQAQPNLGLQFLLSASATCGFDVWWLATV
jgi:hypothetical protein